MKLTFLEASNGKQLNKQFNSASVIPYPHVKKCTSHEFDITTLQEMHDLIKQRAALGQAFLKGNLKKPIIEESRAGKANRSEQTQILALDIDGIRLDVDVVKPITDADLRQFADKILSQMSEGLELTDYIVQGSASLGMKENTISLHIFMLLDTPVSPSALKQWLRYQNFQTGLFAKQIDLSSNAHALSYPLDICVADNTRIIFIAPPTFEDPAKNPFRSNNDRLVIVKKTYRSFDLAPLIKTIDVDHLQQQKLAKLNDLRIANGKTKQRKTMKVTQRSIEGEIRDIIESPDQCNITIISEDWPYIRCNLNGGDSAAYYFNAANPEFLLNFKDEPIFRIQKAAPDFYEEIQDKYGDKAAADNAKRIRPIVFRDEPTDTYWNGIYNPNINEFDRLAPSSKGGVQNFMQTHAGFFDADNDVLEAIMEFNPHVDDNINLNSVPAYINKFKPSKYMKQNTPPAVPIEYGQANLISVQTPFTYKLLSHMLGGGEEELERFINWLAYIFQTKSKSMTAWVLTGVQGTGKGLFYTKILQPLFSPDYVPMRMLGNMEEKYNNYLETALFLVVDEFRMKSASGNTTKVQDQLKNAITEPTTVLRSMNSNQIERPSFTNYIFLTNREDAVQLDSGDRRYNIGIRQETMLDKAHPDLTANVNVLTAELGKFAGILQTYIYDTKLATTCIDNDAKDEMRKLGISDVQHFAEAILYGNIEEIADLVLSVNLAELDFKKQETASAQKYIKRLISESFSKPKSHLLPNEARVIYNSMSGPRDIKEPRTFGILMSHHRVASKKVKINKKSVRAYEIEWPSTAPDVAQTLIDQWFDPKDLEVFINK